MEMSRDIQIACFKEMIKGMEILDMWKDKQMNIPIK
jgi:hypothetical protein